MTYETILFEVSADKVATVTINRPEALNSFNKQMCVEFRDLWARLRDDDSVHAVVLQAAPGRAFCTGVDVKNASDILMSDQLWSKVDPGEYLGPKFNKLWKPVIAAVHGYCAGGALYWINECDIVICSDDAAFFDPHVTYGLVAALEPIGLRQRLNLSEVLRMVLMGNDERIGAQTALRISLVTEVTRLESLRPRAHEIAALIAAKPTLAVQGSIRAIWESLDATRSSALQTALKYPLLANRESVPRVNREAVMKAEKVFVTR
ncbi:MAG: Enoyl-CoA hydratase/isomerase [Hydrocarboniphaga sp.]|uniref:enoyl-CoA hydratase/isomerase family protein n=1 Tax=Hydrocarboniphaga sp. TaxID=2033016 RepID=UPI002636D261|nr:enoyl-CoA hydratase/isomerase family protein [Hydrocarboniphaga sp.]MDB5968731.1 Enoyl-CoA hydratase/isomerase [Hydrocarboniphaga sp.]